ncbi:MAG TPA: phosphoribosylanthranilate isomerase [Herpetosiphonaceae bacterium]|nr:phosphoribosylanthranilate isomerase [Herpetosiphonaceae bacterium]
MAITVKICGIRTVEAALVAAEAGADMIGLVFAPSRRQVDAATARQIVAALRGSPAGRDVMAVGVFVDEAPTAITRLAREVGLDWVQLSGHEPVETVAEIELPAAKALRFDGDASERGWLDQPVACDVLPVLVDAHVAGSFGGAGVVGDWQAAARLARQRPVLLAGGLTPNNVAAAVVDVQPWGVDVSSGVETNGVKDLDKIRAFIHAARTTEAR